MRRATWGAGRLIVGGRSRTPVDPAPSEPGDAELLAAIRAGDHAAFATVFARHASHLRAVAYGVVKAREVAAELVHDVYLGIWSARERLDVRGDLRGYLARAARNRALDWVAREARHRRWLESAHAADPAPASAEDDDAGHGDSDEADRHHDLRVAMAAALAEMPPRQREVCRLRWQEGLGPTAIGARLGVGVKTVETHVRRGLLALRARMREHEGA